MKSIRSFILIAIGMMVFTVTGATHANREQKPKVELLKEQMPFVISASVNDYQAKSELTDVAKANDINVVQLKNVIESFNFLAIVPDVGWQSYQKNYNLHSTIKEIAIKDSDNGIQTQDEDIGCWWCNACRGCGTLPPPPPPVTN